MGMEDYIAEQEARRHARPWYDTMQVCENGHQITSMAESQPEYQKKRCPLCGANTLMACPKCDTRIPGYLHYPDGAYVGEDPTPPYCEECGQPYPWTVKKSKKSEGTKVVPVPFSLEEGGKGGIAKGSKMTPATTKVFVVHGHSEEMKQAAARVLSKLKLDPIILHERPNEGKTIIEKFEKHADVDFAVVLLSPDDMAYPAAGKPKDAKPRARQNVILELGYFVGRLGRGGVFTLHMQGANIELPSDLAGVVYNVYDTAGHWKLELVRELKARGYTVSADDLL